MIGTKPKRFNSSPIHMENHVWAEIVIRIPLKIAVTKRAFAGLEEEKGEDLLKYTFIEIGKLSGFLAIRLRTPCLDITTSWLRGNGLGGSV